MKKLLILAILLCTGCASDYKFGDISRQYCAGTTPELRQALRNWVADMRGTGTATDQQLIDYCAAVGVPLAVLDVVQAEQAARVAE